MVEGVPFEESEKLSYDQGREAIVEQAQRSASEITQNNPPFQNNMNGITEEVKSEVPQQQQEAPPKHSGWGSLFKSPIMGNIFNAGSSVVKQGGQLLGSVA